MTVKIIPTGCPKFTLSLKEHTKKKRLLEAKQILAGLYPFEINEKNILILKASEKGQYDVYLSKEEIKNKRDMKKMCSVILLVIILMILLFFVMHNAAVKNTESLKAQKELERQKQEELEVRKNKDETLKKLKKEYDEKKLLEYEKIFPYIERIYSVMPEKTTIENISIERNRFTVEVTTKDAINILSNFEKSSAFSFIKMNRATLKDGKETVVYNGEFSKFLKEADEKKSVDEKIKFYENEISKMKECSKLKQNIRLSEYIENIRNVMHKNKCNEQYIQLNGNNDNAEIEFFVFSESRDILNFIKEIQEGKENLIDIKTFTLRNSENRSKLQTTICFDSGIVLKQNEDFSEYINKKTDLSEIDRIFYKTAQTVTSAVKASKVKTKQPQQTVPESFSPAQLKKLSYIGLTKINGIDFVIAKDDEMQSIYKLVISDKEINGDFCMKKDSAYMAKVRGEYYEVKR